MKSPGLAIDRDHSLPVVARRLAAVLVCLGLIAALVLVLRFVMHRHYHGDGASVPALARAAGSSIGGNPTGDLAVSADDGRA